MGRQSSRLMSLVFIIFLIGGCITALIIVENSNPNSTDLISIPNTADEGDRVFLLIGVDQLDNNTPLLHSVWLITHPPYSAFFSLQPVYPPNRSAPHGSITIQREDPAAIEKLIETLKIEAYWTDVIWVDETLMAELVEMARAGMEIPENASAKDVIDDMPHPWSSPSAALEAQQGLLMDLCSSSPYFSSLDALKTILGNYPEHLYLEIDETELLKQWQNFMDFNSILECEFPADH